MFDQFLVYLDLRCYYNQLSLYIYYHFLDILKLFPTMYLLFLQYKLLYY
nr:MAG TPA: hypothetical protein [Caudoviricetes sp.]